VAAEFLQFPALMRLSFAGPLRLNVVIVIKLGLERVFGSANRGSKLLHAVIVKSLPNSVDAPLYAIEFLRHFDKHQLAGHHSC
jgi:hypothetical protein